MQEQLDVESLFADQFEDGGFTYQRDKLGNTEFPLGQVDLLTDRFASTWGRALLTLFSKTTPYSAHSRALVQLKENWHVDNTGLSLAHDALFSGVGVFWTLRDSYEHYLDRRRRGYSVSKSDVIHAWETLNGREDDFETFRVQAYLNSGRSAQLKQSKAAFAVFNTHACQLGLAMTLGSLWEIRKGSAGNPDLSELPNFADAIVAGLNAYFGEEHGKARDRRLAFNKGEISSPLNQIANMDTPQAVYFRYFWLQALATPVAWEHLQSWFPSLDAFNDVLYASRRLYHKLLEDQQFKALKTSRPTVRDEVLRAEARSSASKSLMRALRDWFYVEEQVFTAWESSVSQSKSVQKNDEAQSDVGDEIDQNDPATDDEEVDAPVTSVEDLLESGSE